MTDKEQAHCGESSELQAVDTLVQPQNCFTILFTALAAPRKYQSHTASMLLHLLRLPPCLARFLDA
jgi:hypothetical protein